MNHSKWQKYFECTKLNFKLAMSFQPLHFEYCTMNLCVKISMQFDMCTRESERGTPIDGSQMAYLVLITFYKYRIRSVTFLRCTICDLQHASICNYKDNLPPTLLHLNSILFSPAGEIALNPSKVMILVNIFLFKSNRLKSPREEIYYLCIKLTRTIENEGGKRRHHISTHVRTHTSTILSFDNQKSSPIGIPTNTEEYKILMPQCHIHRYRSQF